MFYFCVKYFVISIVNKILCYFNFRILFGREFEVVVKIEVDFYKVEKLSNYWVFRIREV